MNRRERVVGVVRWCAVVVVWLAAAGPAHFAQGEEQAGTRKTENLLIVTIDGLRWQELFGGADERLMNDKFGGVRNLPALRERYWRETAEERREALMPFFWSVMAKEGQVFGDASRSCEVRVTNGKNFSYPGYSEMFCGFADDRINSNDKVPNPNLNVLEWLNQRPPFQGRIAVYATWGVFPSILNAPRAKLPVVAGWVELGGAEPTARERYINELMGELPRVWDDNTFDVITAHGAMEYLRRHRPRILYIAFGETDEWAHLRRYDCYLDAAHLNDRFLRRLWGMVQEMPEYAGKTALVVTTDHGRGGTETDWPNHGDRTPGADRTWIAVMGPDTPGRGIRSDLSATQSQLAATLAALAGQDYAAAEPKAARALAGIVEE